MKVDSVSTFNKLQVDTVYTFNKLKVDTFEVSTFTVIKVDTVSSFNKIMVDTVSTINKLKVDTLEVHIYLPCHKDRYCIYIHQNKVDTVSTFKVMLFFMVK